MRGLAVRRVGFALLLLLPFALTACRAPVTPPNAERIIALAAPRSLRPCCAFGHRLGLSLGGIPLPVEVDNVVDLEDLGRHRYDGGLVGIGRSPDEGLLALEHNGMAYTCRGGFVDVAHVRDYADWTFFLSTRLRGMLDHGGRIELPEEGGLRIVYVAAAPPALIERIGRAELSIGLAEWLAFELSIWHETATWYGWSALAGFSELASAFSPEDLYSNRVGIAVAGAILRGGDVRAVDAFDAAMSTELPAMLERLGVVSHDVTHLAVASIDRARGCDGAWWDSAQRLPAKDLVVRRNLDLGPRIAPWRVPPAKRSSEFAEALAESCVGVPADAVIFEHPEAIAGISVASLVRLDLRPDDDVAEGLPLPDPSSRWLAQSDLRAVVEDARVDILREYGPDADRP